MADAAEPADLNLFEFLSSGHAPTLMRVCLEYWRDHEPGRVLRIVATRRFFERFPFVFDGFANVPGSPVRWTTFDDADEAGMREALDYGSGLIERPEGYNATRVYWSLVEKYCPRLPARHHLLMNLDDLIHQVAAHQRLAGDFSAILFLPGFAYLDDQPSASRRRRVFVGMQSSMLRDRVLAHPQLRTLFVLDEKAAELLQGAGTAAARALGDIEILRIATFVPVADRHAWFDAADVALAPYIRHAGSSGVLMLAASHGIPVISQKFGQMGRWVAEHKLGLAVDPDDPQELAGALRRYLTGPPADYDPEPGYAFARQQSPERFGETLFGALRPYYSGDHAASAGRSREEASF
ncbi:MAG TPA: glycosyltransferase family 4 protein [Bauldia sp.]|nr:glycosyltransferase family 4 protein [Bauldia sp.]